MEKTIGQRVVEVRGGLSQVAFAERIGVHKSTVGRIDRDEYTPDGEFLQALYREFGISPTWVLTGQGEKHIQPAADNGSTSEAVARMQALLAGVDEAEDDELVSKWIELEATLSIAQLLLLLKIAVQGEEWVLEPLCFQLQLNPSDLNSPPSPIWRAAFLPQWKLKLLAGQVQLEELGLICIVDDGDGCYYKLTPRGAHAVNWWVGVLADLGLTHDELKAI